MASVYWSTLTLTTSVSSWILIAITVNPDVSSYTIYVDNVWSGSYSIDLWDHVDFEPNRLFIGKTYADEAFVANTDITIDDLLMWNYELSSSDFQKLLDSYGSAP